MLACATCGSDVQSFYVRRKLPAVLGHEPAGEVVEVGAGVEGVAVGDRVAIHHHAPCGECRRCRRGHETLCERFRSTRLDPGGFAEYVRIQAELVGELLPLDGMDPVLATFTEPLACTLRAQRRVGLGRRRRAARGRRGRERAAARGGGARERRRGGVGARARSPSGSSAPSAGARPRTATSRSTSRSSAPRARTRSPAPRPRSPPAARSASTPRRRPTARSGSTATPSSCASSTSPRAGRPARPTCAPALTLLARRAVRPLELVTHRFPLEETGAALAAQRSGEALKAVVLP